MMLSARELTNLFSSVASYARFARAKTPEDAAKKLIAFRATPEDVAQKLSRYPASAKVLPKNSIPAAFDARYATCRHVAFFFFAVSDLNFPIELVGLDAFTPFLTKGIGTRCGIARLSFRLFRGLLADLSVSSGSCWSFGASEALGDRFCVQSNVRRSSFLASVLLSALTSFFLCRAPSTLRCLLRL